MEGQGFHTLLFPSSGVLGRFDADDCSASRGQAENGVYPGFTGAGTWTCREIALRFSLVQNAHFA